MLAAAVAMPLAPALADPSSNDPYLYTCADLLAAEDGDARVRANMMLTWSIGYMYGRFGGGADGLLESDSFESIANDMVNAFHQICPNVPDMPVGTFTENLANDLQAAQEQDPGQPQAQ
jgi:hypothetical protein